MPPREERNPPHADPAQGVDPSLSSLALESSEFASPGEFPFPPGKVETGGPGGEGEPEKGNLKGKVLAGSIWSIGGYGVSQVIRLGSSMILTRVLFREVFGVMALVNTFVQGLHMFSDLGIGPSLIQNRRGEEPEFFNTAWTLQVFRGLGLWLLTFLIAWPVAHFYYNPGWKAYTQWDLFLFVPAVGLSALISGFNSTAVFTLNRRLDLRKLTFLQLSYQGVAVVIMVAWAVQWKTVWALIGGRLIADVFYAVVSHKVIPGYRNKFHWDKRHARELIHFGKWIFISTVLTFLAQQSDKLIFGKMVTLETLGVYWVAFNLASLPIAGIYRIGDQVAFPAYSEKAREGAGMEETFWRIRNPLLVMGGAVLGVYLVAGRDIISVLYDPRYLEGGWMVQFLALGAWFTVKEYTNGNVLLALGDARWLAACNGSKVAGLVVLVPLGFSLGGFPGAVLGLAGADFIRYVVSLVGLGKHELKILKKDLRMDFFLAAAVGLGFLGKSLAGLPEPSFLAGLVGGLVSLVPWGIFGFFILKKEWGPA